MAGKLNKKTLINNGYIYHENSKGKLQGKDGQVSNVTYFICKDRSGCPARANLKNGQLKVTIIHNHPPDKLAEEKSLFRDTIRNNAIYGSQTARSSYDKAQESLPNAAVHLPFAKMEANFYRWRASGNPPAPRSLKDFGTILQNSEWSGKLTFSKGSQFKVNIIESTLPNGTNSISLMFFCEEHIKKFDTTQEMIYDATFQVTPTIPKTSQLLTILVKKFGYVFPVAWVLMENKHTICYEDILDNLVPYFSCLKIISADYEVALRKAANSKFPNADFCGCNAHYWRAINNRIYKNENIKKNWTDEIDLVRRKIIALSYLPSEKIGTAFNDIKAKCSAATSEILKLFFKYYEKEWINKVTPDKFSVYRRPRRTTNDAECHNNILRQKLGRHPSAWLFLDRLLTVASSSNSDFESARRGFAIRRQQRPRYEIRGQVLLDLWQQLDDGLSINDFLTKCCDIHEEVLHRMEYNDDDGEH